MLLDLTRIQKVYEGIDNKELTHSDECHLWHKDCLIQRLIDENLRLRQIISGIQDGFDNDQQEIIDFINEEFARGDHPGDSEIL